LVGRDAGGTAQQTTPLSVFLSSGFPAASALRISLPRLATRQPLSLSTATARASTSSGAASPGAAFSGHASSGNLPLFFSATVHPIEASVTASFDADEIERGNPA
jgi:hypothetical protein